MAVFYNQATLSYTGGTVMSNVTVGELREYVSVTKTAVSPGYAPGGTVTYVVSIANAGDSAVGGVAVTDDLGAVAGVPETLYPLRYVAGSLLYLVDGVPEAAPPVTAGPPLVISGIQVPAQANVALIYQAEVTNQAPLGEGASITNTATVTGECIGTPLTAQAIVTMELAPRLAINKAISPEVVTGCSELTYTFTIQNHGSVADAEAGITLSDTFAPVLRDVEVSVDGAPMARSAYSYDETSGRLVIGNGLLTVPAATYTQSRSGEWTCTPGVTVVTVTGVV